MLRAARNGNLLVDFLLFLFTKYLEMSLQPLHLVINYHVSGSLQVHRRCYFIVIDFIGMYLIDLLMLQRYLILCVRILKAQFLQNASLHIILMEEIQPILILVYEVPLLVSINQILHILQAGIIEPK